MSKYKVLKDFQWGKTPLAKDKIVTIEDQEKGLSKVSIEYSIDTFIVGTKAVQGMVLLKKIEKI